MKRLYLMRHAHCPHAYDLADIQRPLSDQGRTQAHFIGQYCRKNTLIPSIILCSNALRTRQTLEALTQAADLQPEILYSEELYHGGAGEHMHKLQTLDDRHDSALLIGHNPVIPALIAFLTNEDQSPRALYDGLIGLYAPATLTQLHCPIDSWSALSPYANALVTVTQPESGESAE